jgi:gluconate 2-dehydrogenase gamma chain
MLSRRELMADWPAILAGASQPLDAQSQAQRSFESFTPAQVRVIQAIAAQIIPTDDTPGATEAGVIWFIDRAISGFHRDLQDVYRKGIASLEEAPDFAALPAERRIEILKSIEKSEFFTAVRTHTIMGFLANPEYGGNRDRTGWKVIGFSDSHVYRPPFGEYDRQP